MHALFDLAFAAAKARGSGASDARAAAAAASGGSVRLALPAGDMSGDGRADVLMPTLDAATGALGLGAMRGADGAELWWRPIPADDAALEATRDLTGDGRADALVVGFTLDDETTRGGCFLVCAVLYTARYHWDVTVVSGADGADAWSRTYPGEFSLEYVEAIFVATGTARATNVTLFALPGEERVVVDAFGADFTPVLYLVDSRSEALDGASGALDAARERIDTPDYALMFPVGDATGDGREDYAWEVDEGIYTLAGQTGIDVDLIDGATLADAWGIDRPGFSWFIAAPAGADLTGDGRADLFLLELGSGAYEYRTTVLSGANGATPWGDRRGVPIPIGDITGDGGADLVLVEVDSEDVAGPFTLQRVNGATGAALVRTHPDFGTIPNAATGISFGGDHDGDGALDAVLNHVYTDDVSYRMSGLIESGATGAPIAETDVAGLRPLVPMGDFDGDGLADVLALLLGFAETQFDFDAAGLSGPGLVQLWSFHETYPRLPGLYIYASEALTATAGRDLLYTVIDDARQTRMRGIDGASGAALWTA